MTEQKAAVAVRRLLNVRLSIRHLNSFRSISYCCVRQYCLSIVGSYQCLQAFKMYPDEGTSKQGLLPLGPSRRNPQRSTGDVDLKGIVVDNPSNASEALELSDALPKGKRCFTFFVTNTKTHFLLCSSPVKLGGRL